MWNWGKKKEEPRERKPTPPAQESYASPSLDLPKPGPPTAASDMFGGMNVARRPNRRPKSVRKDDDAASNRSMERQSIDEGHDSTKLSPAKAPPPTQQPQHGTTTAAPLQQAPIEEVPKEAAPPPSKPFYSKYVPQTSGFHFDVDDERTLAVRTRLERFYAEYNPSKLANIDATIKAYAGREAELFQALISKYGPEPPPSDPSTHGNKSSKQHPAKPKGRERKDEFDGKTPPTTPPSQPLDAAPPSSFEPEPTSNTDWGASNADDGWGTGETTTGANFGSDTAGGFGFVSDNEQKGAAVQEGSVFGFIGDTTGGQQEGTSAFGFVANEEGTPSKAQAGVEAAHQPQSPPHNQQEEPSHEPSSDSEGEEEDSSVAAIFARQERELASAKSWLKEQHTVLGTCVARLGEVIKNRHELVQNYRSTEERIEHCIATEDYEAAENFNTELSTIGQEIDDADAEMRKLADTLSEKECSLESALKDLASLFVSQRQTLKEHINDEERRIERHIDESSLRLGHQGERVRAELERATRQKHNVEQEVVNLAQRKSKIDSKLEDQTKGLRAQRDEIAGEKAEIESEIKELEAKLATLRRALAEKNAAFADVEDKLALIMAGEQAARSEIVRQLEEEQNKLEVSTQIVKQLSEKEEKILREETDLQNEAEKLRGQLQRQRLRISTYDGYSKMISDSTVPQCRNYFDCVLRMLLQLRDRGCGFLCPVPHRASETSDEALATLAQIELQQAQVQMQLQAEATKQSALASRLHAIGQAVPVVEAAKKAAAMSKQFREASAKTEELKKLSEEKTEITSGIASSNAEVERLQIDAGKLAEELRYEKARAAQRMSSFVIKYFDMLQKASDSVNYKSGISRWIRGDLDAEPSAEDELEAAVVVNACSQLHRVLLDELQRAAPNVVNEKKPTKPEEQDASVQKKESAAAVAPAEIVDENPVLHQPPAVEVITDSQLQPERSNEEIEHEIDELEQRISGLAEQDKFEECEELSLRVNELKARLQH